jgi:hypothetical protein
MRLHEFKAKYLAKLLEIKRELLDKYPSRAERIEYLTDVIASKLYHLRVYTLTDYLFTVYNAVKEFREFEWLVPPEKEISQLLGEPDE